MTGNVGGGTGGFVWAFLDEDVKRTDKGGILDSQGNMAPDGIVGPFLERISLPQPLNTNYRGLVADGKDNVLIAVTGVNGSGISVVDLTSLPVAAPYPLIDPPIGGPVSRNSASSTPLSRRRDNGRTAILHPRLISSQAQKPPTQ